MWDIPDFIEGKYPYGESIKICVRCNCLNPGYEKRCVYCGGRLKKIKDLLYYGYKMEKY